MHQSPFILDLYLRKTRSGKSRDYRSYVHRCPKASLSKRSPRKRKARVFKLLRFGECFRKSSVFVTDQCGRKA